MIDKLPLQSPNMVNENIDKIAALFPNCITETANGKAIDFDLLKQELTPEIVDGFKERYRLEWPGKRESIVMANIPTTKTLRPIIKDSVNFDTTQNLYIEGDNLEVLKLLQESYLGKVKMIYIDPPYNTGSDFVYKDNFATDAEQYKSENEKDEYGQRMFANPDSSGRYHSDWLSMIYPRLKLARNLLTDDGVIFISIGQNEIQNLIKILDEIFGENNQLGLISRQMKSGGGSQGKYFSHNLDYVVAYAKQYDVARYFKGEISEELKKKVYNQIEKVGNKTGDLYRSMGLYQSSLDIRPNLRYWILCPDGSYVIPPGESFPELLKDGEKVKPVTADGVWRWSYEKYVEELKTGNIEFKQTKSGILLNENKTSSKWNVYTKIWLNDREEEGQIPSDLITKFENRHSSKELTQMGIPFDFAKPIGLVKYLIKILDQENDILILDFFSGSATTAHAVMQLNSADGGNRKFIMVQVPELTDEKSEAYKTGFKNICEIGKERIRRAGNQIKEDYEAAENAKTAEIKFETEDESLIDIGFRVYRLDSSNMQDVYYKPRDFKQENLDLFASNIKPDRSPEDLLAQVMLSWGLPLHYKIESLSIQNKQVFKIEENSLFACFDNGIDEAFAKEIATHLPLRIVFKDDSFKDDTAKENVKQLLKQLSPNTEMKVI